MKIHSLEKVVIMMTPLSQPCFYPIILKFCTFGFIANYFNNAHQGPR